jgi:hypothetical protein
MSTQAIVVIVALIAIIAFLVARRGGPRVTTVERTISKDKEGDDR